MVEDEINADEKCNRCKWKRGGYGAKKIGLLEKSTFTQIMRGKDMSMWGIHVSVYVSNVSDEYARVCVCV